MTSILEQQAKPSKFTFRKFVRMSRLKFIPYSLILHLFGVAYVILEKFPVKLHIVILAQLYIWTLHLLAQICNEYFDIEADRLNSTPTAWTGGSRLFIEGALDPAVAKYSYLALIGLALTQIMIVPILVPDFRAVLPFSIIGLLLAWQYSSPPVEFTHRGLGEFIVATIFSTLPIYGVIVQSAIVTKELLSICAVLWVTTYSRMMVMNMPDRVGDALAGKRTLVVRLGIERAIYLYVFLQFVAYGVLLYLFRDTIRLSFIVALLAVAPIGWWQGWRLLRGDWKDPSKLADAPKFCSLHVAATATALLIVALGQIAI